MSKFTVFGNLFAVMAIIIIAVIATGNSPVKAQAQPTQRATMQATQAHTQTPVPTQTATPEPTETPTQAIKVVVVQVSPTIDVANLAAVRRVEDESRQRQLDAQRQEVEIESARAGVFARNVFVSLAALFLALVMLWGGLMLVNAYVTSWRNMPKPQAQPLAQTGTPSHDVNMLDEHEAMMNDMPKIPEGAIDDFIAAINKETGKMPPESVARDWFGGQDEYRDFLAWMDKHGLSKNVPPRGRFITAKFAKLAEITIAQPLP